MVMSMDEFYNRFKMKARDNVLLWAVIVVMILFAGITERFGIASTRPFSLNEIPISYPYIANEKYSDKLLLFVCFLVPLAVTTALIFSDGKSKEFQRFYKTISSFTFAMGLAVFITTFLKIRLAKLRPDFLARCGAKLKKGDLETVMFTVDICTAPYGEFVLNDGFKSCPSGHSTVSMCGMLFLSLWLYYTYAREHTNGIVKILCFTPLLVALDVVTSRIYDFKHDYYDVTLGSVIGIAATLVAVQFVHLEELKEEQELILPV